jgi:hypothetical protein
MTIQTTTAKMTDLIADLRKEQATVVALLEDPEATPEILTAVNDRATTTMKMVQLGVKHMKNHPKLRASEAQESHRKSLGELVGAIDTLIADASAQLDKFRAAGIVE